MFYVCGSPKSFLGKTLCINLVLRARQNLEKNPQRLISLFTNTAYSIYTGCPKKCPIAIFSLNLFQRSDYTFSHVFRNQSFEPVSSKHFKLLALSAATSSTASSANTLIYINLNINYDKITRDVNEPFGFNIGCAILLNTTVLVYASRTTLRRSFRRWMIRKR